MSCSIQTIDGRTAFWPGETIDLQVEWALDRQPDWIELRLVWYTQGKGQQDVSIVETTRWDHPPLVDRRRASLQLPEGPYSFSGKLISLIWAVEIVSSTGDSQRLDMVIAPEAHEVLLEPKP